MIHSFNIYKLFENKIDIDNLLVDSLYKYFNRKIGNIEIEEDDLEYIFYKNNEEIFRIERHTYDDDSTRYFCFYISIILEKKHRNIVRELREDILGDGCDILKINFEYIIKHLDQNNYKIIQKYKKSKKFNI